MDKQVGASNCSDLHNNQHGNTPCWDTRIASSSNHRPNHRRNNLQFQQKADTANDVDCLSVPSPLHLGHLSDHPNICDCFGNYSKVRSNTCIMTFSMRGKSLCELSTSGTSRHSRKRRKRSSDNRAMSFSSTSTSNFISSYSSCSIASLPSTLLLVFYAMPLFFALLQRGHCTEAHQPATFISPLRAQPKEAPMSITPIKSLPKSEQIVNNMDTVDMANSKNKPKPLPNAQISLDTSDPNSQHFQSSQHKHKTQRTLQIDPSQDLYCGTNWMDAFTNCHAPCPENKDAECEDLGLVGYRCWGYTGCAEKLESSGTGDNDDSTGGNGETGQSGNEGDQGDSGAPDGGFVVIGGGQDGGGQDGGGDAAGQDSQESGSGEVSPTSPAILETTPIPTSKPTRRKKEKPAQMPSANDENAGDDTGNNSGNGMDNGAGDPSAPTVSTNDPTLSPSKASFRPYLQSVTTVATSTPSNNDIKIDPSALSTLSKSYGVIFDIATTYNSPAILIQGLEFYTDISQESLSPNDWVEYEVYIKLGSWHGAKGDLDKFFLIGNGNITSTTNDKKDIKLGGVGQLTRIPLENFTPIQMSGNGTRYSMYVGLSSKNLFFQRSTTQQSGGDESFSSGSESVPFDELSYIGLSQDWRGYESGDHIFLTQTPELLLFEGAAVMAYPFSKAKQSIFYRAPRGWVGRLWYHRDPCVESAVDWPCVAGNRPKEDLPDVSIGGDGSSSLPSGSSGSATDSTSSGSNANGSNNGNNGTMNAGNVNMGINAPSSQPSTSLSPTITSTKIYIILTLNSAKRKMRPLEQNQFENALLSFFQSSDYLLDLEVEVYRVKVHYQQVLSENDWRIPKDSMEGGNGGSMSERDLGVHSHYRALQGNETLEIVDLGNTETSSTAAAISTIEPSPSNNATMDGSDDTPNAAGNVTEDSKADNAVEGTTNTTEEAPADTVTSSTSIMAPPTTADHEDNSDNTVLEVTLIVSILYSNLPYAITQDLLRNRLTDSSSQTNFIQAIQILPSTNNKESPSTFFSNIQSVPSVLTVDQITLPPTQSPSMSPTPLITEEIIEEKPLIPPHILAALVAGIIWCCLTIYSMVYLKRARDGMRFERQLAKLTSMGGGGLMEMEMGFDRKGNDREEEDRFSENGHSDEEGGKNRKNKKYGKNRMQEEDGEHSSEEEESDTDGNDVSSMEDSYSSSSSGSY